MKATFLSFVVCLLCIASVIQTIHFVGEAATDKAGLQSEMCDLALINGRFWTGVAESPWAEATAISNQRIIRVGTGAEIRELVGAKTQVIDLKGHLAAPGFNDAHIHFLGGALGLTEIDLTGARSLKAMQERVAEFARKNPDAKWITGRGWEYAWLPDGRLPRRGDLDVIVKDRPVFLRAYDGHTAWANSQALKEAGITRETKFQGFGEIVREPETGEPTGALKEGAQSLIARLIPEPSREQKLSALRQGMKLAASLGLTSIQNASGSPEEWSLYEELLSRGELTLRVSMAFSVSPNLTQERLDQFIALREQRRADPMLRAGAAKILIDGVIESHTAAMLEPYSDKTETRGEAAHSAEQYNNLVERLDRAGFQIYTHAIGDRGVRMALDAYERAQRINQRLNPRHRIEHIEVISRQDIPRFAALGVMASMEPIHADPDTVEVWSRAVGPERIRRAFAWGDLARSGAALVYSSDWPACISLDPIRGLHNAVNRRTTDGKPKAGWIPEQRVSLQQALRAYTATGAYASFEEAIKGKLAPGMLADVIVFSEDLFRIEPIRIHETRVVMTVFDGRVIYRDHQRLPQ
jgi:hypothetical protein